MQVASAVRAAEARAEVLVGWIQVGGVLVFAAGYALSRPAFAQAGGPEPVPLALAVYGLFTAWRLRLAYRGPLNPALLTLSSVLDVAVLAGMLWSFTLQYDLPPALYLKAPTLFYVFVLIALRALRFDPAQVIVTGLSAAVAWLALVAFAAFGPEPAPVTRSYPEYMTSLSLLWGAEFDRVGAILLVTTVLAVAVTRARALLVRTAVEAQAAGELSRFVGADAAGRIRGGGRPLAPGDGETRTAAILFIDLRGFTATTRGWTAADVVALLGAFHARIVPAVEAAGGTVDKFLGDGVLVSFGAAAVTGREAAQALEAGIAVLAAADVWATDRAGAPTPGVAVAVTTGEVAYGVVGHGDRLEYTVIGEAVNLAAKLEKHAKVEAARLITTTVVVQQAQTQGWTGPPGREVRAAQVEGLEHPLDLVVLA